MAKKKRSRVRKKSRKTTKKSSRRTSKTTRGKKSSRTSRRSKPKKRSRAKKSARTRVTRKSVTRKAKRPSRKAPRRSAPKQSSFATVYLWLVIIDALLSAFLLFSNSVLGQLGGTALSILVGFYGFGVFVLSIIAFFIFIVKGLPRQLLWVPTYVVLAPIIIFLLGLAVQSVGTLQAVTWVAILVEFVLATWLLSRQA